MNNFKSMDPAELARFQKMQEAADAQQRAMMKEMGLDPNEFGHGVDPEMAALEKQLAAGEDLDDDALLA